MATTARRSSFLDADVVLEPGGLDRIVAARRRRALSVQPFHVVGGRTNGSTLLLQRRGMMGMPPSGQWHVFGPVLVTTRAELRHAVAAATRPWRGEVPRRRRPRPAVSTLRVVVRRQGHGLVPHVPRRAAPADRGLEQEHRRRRTGDEPARGRVVFVWVAVLPARRVGHQWLGRRGLHGGRAPPLVVVPPHRHLRPCDRGALSRPARVLRSHLRAVSRPAGRSAGSRGRAGGSPLGRNTCSR